MSITLTASEVNALVIGGVTIETDASAAVTNIVLDFLAMTATLQVLKGTVTGQSFAPGQLQQGSFSLTVDLTTGNYAGNGIAGTLSAGALNAAQNAIFGLRNSAESLANGAVLGGTTVPWAL